MLVVQEEQWVRHVRIRTCASSTHRQTHAHRLAHYNTSPPLPWAK